MNNIYDQVEILLASRNAQREQKALKRKTIFAQLETKIEEIAHILQCDKFLIIEKAGNLYPRVVVQLLYYPRGIEVEIECWAVWRKSKIEVHILVDGLMITIDLSNPDIVAFAIKKIIEFLATRIEKGTNNANNEKSY